MKPLWQNFWMVLFISLDSQGFEYNAPMTKK